MRGPAALVSLTAVLAAGIALAAMLPSAQASKRDTDPIVGFWNYGGGVVQVSGGPTSFSGVVVKATRFSTCTHPVGEAIWKITNQGSSYVGTHMYFKDTSTCIPGSGGPGKSTWSIVETDSGYVLHFCSTDPTGSGGTDCDDLTRSKPVKPPATTTQTTTQANTGWLELLVTVQPASAAPSQPFRVCVKAVAGGATLCFSLTPGNVLVPMNHGKRVEWPAGTKVQACEDEVAGLATPGCLQKTFGTGANRFTFVNRPDTTPPTVKALPRGLTQPASRAPLEVIVKDDSGQATLHATLWEGGTKIKENAWKVKATGKKFTLNTLFAADLTGPMYYCVWAEDTAGNKSKKSPNSSCAWIKLVVPIGKVSNGCGGGDWDVLVWAQNYFGNEHTYQNSNINPLALEYTVNFKDACDLHDAGYGGETVVDKINGGTIDFHAWSRPAVDDKFLKDMRTLCERAIPAKAKTALTNCKARGGNASFGAESLYNFVHKQGWRFFDADLTKPGTQKTGHRRNF